MHAYIHWLHTYIHTYRQAGRQTDRETYIHAAHMLTQNNVCVICWQPRLACTWAASSAESKSTSTSDTTSRTLNARLLQQF